MEKWCLSWTDIEHLSLELVRQIHFSGFRPDMIIGLDRGGLVPSVMLSQLLSVPHNSLKVSLRDNPDTESLLWAPEMILEGKRILLVDDINDSGATQTWIKQDWASAVAGTCPDFIDKHWHDSVKFAVLVDNESSAEDADFAGRSINKAERDVWVDFPWESWWSRKTTD